MQNGQRVYIPQHEGHNLLDRSTGRNAVIFKILGNFAIVDIDTIGMRGVSIEFCQPIIDASVLAQRFGEIVN